MSGHAILPLTPLHGTPALPVPHWAVLLAAVPVLWVLIGGGMVLLDRLLGQFE